MKVRFRPTGNRVLVRRDTAPTTTESGLLHIPDTFYEFEHPPQWGTVLAIGPGRTLKSGERREIEGLKVGDHVLIGKFTGHDLEIGGEKVLVSKIEDVIAIEEE